MIQILIRKPDGAMESTVDLGALPQVAAQPDTLFWVLVEGEPPETLETLAARLDKLLK